MAKQPEHCPLCGAPRPPKANRCGCNYVFEYEMHAPVVRSSARRRAASGAGDALEPASGITIRDPRVGQFLIVVLVVAVLGIVAGTFTVPAGRDDDHGMGLLLVFVGAFAILGGMFDWQWFMTARRARRVTFWIGRPGARLFYAAVGGWLMGGGIRLL
ncbi:MAG TPA: immunity 17 family protein [Kofleriaceae bacterium]|nr:immunity 17 family protein [Kofleriaceae bacterium]